MIELFRSNNDVKEYLARLRSSGVYKNGSKSKVWRKIASMPIEVDRFFTALYGRDYYKEKDFFKKFPEWLVVDPKDL